MRTEVGRPTGLRPAAVAVALFASTLPGLAYAQQSDGPSLFLVDTDTRIEKVGWSFPSGSAIPTSRLETQVAVKGPGSLTWAKKAFDFIPFVPSPDFAPFSPVVLQRDVVRLRRLYRSSGFPSVVVDYDVALDTTVNRVAITMVVDQGEPLTIDTVTISVTGETPDDLQDEWTSFTSRLADARGRRFSQEERSRLVQETTNWFTDRGYPWVQASLVRADTSGTDVSVALEARPGARARVGEIRIEGNERLEPPVLRREIPIRIGDWYSARRVSEGQRELFELDLVRRALGDLVESQPQDTSVVVRYRLNEAQPRLIWGRVGWRSESGVGGEAHWQHRNFYGGARTLTLSSNFESGWGALEATNTRTVGLSALVRQPYLIQRTMAGTFGPFVRFRDDFRDRSLLYGLETSVIYRVRPLETVTAQHELSRLRVDDTYQLTPLSEVIAQGDSVFAPIFVKSIFRLRGAYGTLDDRINPTSGYLVEPSLEVTGPSGISDVEFFRVSVQGMAARRLTPGLTLYMRGTAGRLFPFGESDPESGVSRTRAIVGLRDVMFTAGGTNDVRGWANGLMGSKIPDVGVDEEGVVVADRFVPAGGLVRLTGTAELGMPFPLLSDPHRTYVFFDAGRVWSPGETFDPGDPELRRESWAYAVGGGLEFGTLVGPIRVGVGYKLNPVPVDLLSPGVVARAIVDGVPLDQLEAQSYRRWHLHLSIGRGF